MNRAATIAIAAAPVTGVRHSNQSKVRVTAFFQYL